jgi:predicted component of type VI protein secretion system
VPAMRLGGDPDTPEASRLGWNTWLGSEQPCDMPADVQFRPAPHLR